MCTSLAEAHLRRNVVQWQIFPCPYPCCMAVGIYRIITQEIFLCRLSRNWKNVALVAVSREAFGGVASCVTTYLAHEPAFTHYFCFFYSRSRFSFRCLLSAFGSQPLRERCGELRIHPAFTESLFLDARRNCTNNTPHHTEALFFFFLLCSDPDSITVLENLV
jgi:hypothetical protein